MKRIHIIGGGTFSYVRNHLALAAPAFGGTAKKIAHMFMDMPNKKFGWELHLTQMAGGMAGRPKLNTNDDVAALVDRLVADHETKMIIMTAALCDFDGQIGEVPSGSHADRLHSREGDQTIKLTMADKIIGRIRKTRKDILAIGCKTTTGATPDEQYLAGLRLLKTNSLNLVLANDTVTRLNMVITPEEARYHETTDRNEVLKGLLEIALARMTNTFTRSTVVPGDSVPWNSNMIPENLRKVVDHCIERGAYKPFLGATVGHFATRLDDKSIITSKRKHNYNKLAEEGMVKIDYEGDEKVIAHGFKPSVGGQSQRIIFREHEDVDCIVHFHSPMRPDAPDAIPHRSQKFVECGSHQCGAQTSAGLGRFGDIKAVMLDEHGPNITFSRNTPPEKVIEFIERNFVLEDKTGGMV